jgi:hypothetical protein
LIVVSTVEAIEVAAAGLMVTSDVAFGLACGDQFNGSLNRVLEPPIQLSTAMTLLLR